MATPNQLTDSELAALTSGSDNPLPTILGQAFRHALAVRGYAHTDTSEIPEVHWNGALNDVARRVLEEFVKGDPV